jgi:hypothetical protein
MNQGWIFSIGTWDAPWNDDGSRGILWNKSESSDPSQVAEDIAREHALQSDALFCLKELATGKRYEVLVKPQRVINYVTASSKAI